MAISLFFSIDKLRFADFFCAFRSSVGDPDPVDPLSMGLLDPDP
jgi:hypothetical protein